MNILSHIFGRKRPTAADIAQEISRASAELAKANERAETTRAALSGIAIMSDIEHAAAVEAHAEAQRSVQRLNSRIAALQQARTEAEKAEADAALVERANAARRALEVEVPKLLNDFDRLGAEMGAVLGKLKAIRIEIEAVNEQLVKNPVSERIPSIDATYRKEPDRVTPERREMRQVWICFNRETGQWEEPGIYIFENGERVPKNHMQCRREMRELVVAPEHRQPGHYLDSLEGIRLPPGRVGGRYHWPKKD